MRILFGIAMAVVFFVTWGIGATVGKSTFTASIDPIAMMTTTNDLLPQVQYDQGTIFLPEGVHYN